MVTIRHSIDRIRAYATARNWTKSRLAREAGMIDTTLRDFHNEDWNPTLETVRRLEAVVPDDFVAGDLVPPPGGSPTGADIDEELVRKLAGLLVETGLNEIEYGAGDWHLRVSRGAPATATVIAPPGKGNTEAAPIEADTFIDDPGAVLAPMVGVVYTAPEPGQPPFVKVGDTVTEDQPVLLIEAMKVFNQITAPRSGKVSQILVNNGTPVEYGEALMIIE